MSLYIYTKKCVRILAYESLSLQLCHVLNVWTWYETQAQCRAAVLAQEKEIYRTRTAFAVCTVVGNKPCVLKYYVAIRTRVVCLCVCVCCACFGRNERIYSQIDICVCRRVTYAVFVWFMLALVRVKTKIRSEYIIFGVINVPSRNIAVGFFCDCGREWYGLCNVN